MKKLVTIITLSWSIMYQNIALASDQNLEKRIVVEHIYSPLYEVKQMIDDGADINTVSSQGNYLVSYVANLRSPESLEGWIKLGADINKVNSDMSTPIFWAIYGNSVQNVKMLLKYGAKLNKKNKYGDTPLHLAINGIGIYHWKIAINLIKNGADVNLLDANGNSPLNLLRKRKEYNYWGPVEEEIEKLLISKGAIDVSTFSPVPSDKKSIKESILDRSTSQKNNSQSVRQDGSTCNNGWRKESRRSSRSQGSADNCKAEENYNPIH